jgi:hypothetical protein
VISNATSDNFFMSPPPSRPSVRLNRLMKIAVFGPAA